MKRIIISDAEFNKIRSGAQRLVQSLRSSNQQWEKEHPESEIHISEYEYYTLEYKLVEKALAIKR